MLVGDDLDLDVARPLDVLLDVHRVVAEGVLRLAARRVERPGELLGLAHHPHPLAPPTGRRLEQDRIAEALGHLRGLRGVAQRLGRAGNDGDAGANGQLPRRRLAPHGGDGLGGRADEDEPRVAHEAREPLALRQEAVSGVDRLGAHPLRHLDDAIALEVALARRGRADVDRLVGFTHVRRLHVGVGVHRHRANPHLATGANDPQGDLAAVGDQELAEHQSTRGREDERTRDSATGGGCRACGGDSGRACPAASPARRSGEGGCRGDR